MLQLYSGGNSAKGCTRDFCQLCFMSVSTYNLIMILTKSIVWLRTEVKSPPFSAAARIEAGMLLRKLQRGELLTMPQSRPMPTIGKSCHELRIVDESATWRVIYHLHTEAVVVLHVFAKTTPQTPVEAIRLSQRRLRDFFALVEKE